MKNIHICWSKPFTLKSKTKFYMEDFALLTMILSALKWQEKNGPLTMITDVGEYFNQIGLKKLWNGGIEELEPPKVKPDVFWAGGKIYALDQIKEPVTMIDTDMIVWENIQEELGKKEVVAIHNEEIFSDVYPSKEHFKMNENYNFNYKWDWNVKPLNTALLSINNTDFKDYYCFKSKEFMENIKGHGDNLTYMVFAEQRLLSMCLEEKNISYDTLLNIETDFYNPKRFTHIWGEKNRIIANNESREKFCLKCVKRIIMDYPDKINLLEGIFPLRQYLFKL